MKTHRDKEFFEKSKGKKKERSNGKFKRKTFFHVNKLGQSRKVTASGIIFYVLDVNEKVYWLMRNFKGRLEDLGGITKDDDRFPLDAGIKATLYRTGGMLFGTKEKKSLFIKRMEDIVKRYNKNRISQVYIDDSKYLLFMIRIPYCYYKNSILDESFVWLENFEGADIHPRLSVIQQCPNITNDVIMNNLELNKKSRKYKPKEKVGDFPPLETDLPESSKLQTNIGYKDALTKQSSEECSESSELSDNLTDLTDSLFSLRLDELCKKADFYGSVEPTTNNSEIISNDKSQNNFLQRPTDSGNSYRPKSNSMPNTPSNYNSQSLCQTQFYNNRPVSYSEPNTPSNGLGFNTSVYNHVTPPSQQKFSSVFNQNNRINDKIKQNRGNLMIGSDYMKPVHDQTCLSFDNRQQSMSMDGYQSVCMNQQQTPMYNQQPLPVYNQQLMSVYDSPPVTAYNQQTINMQGRREGYIGGQQSIHMNGFAQPSYQSHDMSAPPGFERKTVTTGRLSR